MTLIANIAPPILPFNLAVKDGGGPGGKKRQYRIGSINLPGFVWS